MPAMLLSIKPEYAQRIIDGTKGFEFRTRRCREDINKIIFYSTAPESKVVGEAEIEEIISDAPSTVWELCQVIIRANLLKDITSELRIF